jgi:HAE1 family hydrophobic/amphiphilic exporter-1
MNHLQTVADDLVRRLNEKPGLTDVFTSFRADVPSLHLDIDRKEADRLGVAVDQIFKVLRSALGRGQTGNRGRLEALRSMKVANDRGQMVPLATVVRARVVSGPTVIYRLDREMMAEITANLAPGVSLAEARALCEQEAGTTLPKDYRLTWLSEMPPAQEAK